MVSVANDAVKGTVKTTSAPFPGRHGAQGPIGLALEGANFTSKLARVGAGIEQRPFSIAARQSSDESGHPKGTTIAFTDVTDLVRAQTARDTFVATVSHELRTPRTSILGYLEISNGQPTARAMDIIERNANRLLSLVNDLLLVASEDLELRRAPTNVSDLLQKSALAAARMAAAKDITIATEASSDITARVDAGQLAKALDHILSNAIKFSDKAAK